MENYLTENIQSFKKEQYKNNLSYFMKDIANNSFE